VTKRGGPPARFLIFDSAGDAWPRIALPQVAFAGRSNVGKSSLLNALTGQKHLARTSRTPGRTRGIVFFEIEGRYAFADLPGYGFAKVSKEERDSWKRLVEGYFSSCPRLRKVYLLVDLRRGPEEEERMLAEFLASAGVAYRWVATKADKLKASELRAAAGRFAGEGWLDAGGPPAVCSSESKAGIDALWKDIRNAFSS
jgi:GTP-binding protein